MVSNKVEFFNTKRYNMDLNLYTCGKEICSRGMKIGPLSRYHYLIHYVVRGKGTFQVNNKKYFVQSNQGFLIEPDILTTYESDKEEPWEYLWIGFIGSKAKEYLNRANLSINNPIFTYYNGEGLEECLDKIIQNLKVDNTSDILLLSNLYEFMYLLVDNNERYLAKEYMGDIQQEYVEKAKLYCENNFHNKISVQDVANHTRLARTYLNRLFSEYANKSPKRYIMELRINKACKLLLETNLDINTISSMVGYNNQFQFSKIFKKYKAVSPSQYREKVPKEWFLEYE